MCSVPLSSDALLYTNNATLQLLRCLYYSLGSSFANKKPTVTNLSCTGKHSRDERDRRHLQLPAQTSPLRGKKNSAVGQPDTQLSGCDSQSRTNRPLPSPLACAVESGTSKLRGSAIRMGRPSRPTSPAALALMYAECIEARLLKNACRVTKEYK